LVTNETIPRSWPGVCTLAGQTGSRRRRAAPASAPTPDEIETKERKNMKHLLLPTVLATGILFCLALPATAGSWTASGNSGTVATFPGITPNDVSIRINGITYSSTSTATAGIGVFYSVTNTYSVTDTPPWNTLDLNYFDIDAAGVVSASLIQIDPVINSFITLCRATSVDSVNSATVSCSFAPQMDFSRYVYTVQVNLSRTATNSVPTVRGLRIH
jgi:hypothetical protein